MRLLIRDFALVLVSLFLVFSWFCLHLRSGFLSLVGMSIIFLSFPFTAFIVSGIFRVGYFGYLQIIAIFLVCGIAADDIFVFNDAWKQSEYFIQNDKRRRMAYAFRRSSRTMSITSLTTAAAFYSNVISPIMPIRAFGIFAGTLIPINFLLVILMMPAAVTLYEENFKYRFCFCMKRFTDEGKELT
jgi:protein dispatched 1